MGRFWFSLFFSDSIALSDGPVVPCFCMYPMNQDCATFIFVVSLVSVDRFKKIVLPLWSELISELNCLSHVLVCVCVCSSLCGRHVSQVHVHTRRKLSSRVFWRLHRPRWRCRILVLITSAKEVVFSSAFVCLFVSRIMQKALNWCSQNLVKMSHMDQARNH